MNSSKLKVMFLGDLFGEPGRRVLKEKLPELQSRFKPDITIVNGENAANGLGISQRIYKELSELNVDVFTSGNHIYHVKDIFAVLNNTTEKLIRPYNFPKSTPGRGIGYVEAKGTTIAVINLQGNLFIQPIADNAFAAVDAAIAEASQNAEIILVDFHAETTSEKRAMAWYLDGKVQLLVGTHTHILTADEEILPQGTGYITDLGMCGPYHSVIGMDKNIVVNRFRQLMSQRFEVASEDIRLTGICCEIDLHTKKAVSIKRIDERQV